ncbi:MAG: metallophosphoesterase [Pseudomonadota bacterium]
MIYAVGDIHGYLDQLERALALIEADGGPDAPIVFLGDYVDRGPDVPGVLDRLTRGLAEGRPWTCLLGNHDRFFRDFLDHGTLTDTVLRPGITWLHRNMGGRETLAAYLAAGDVPSHDSLPTDDPDDCVDTMADLLATARARSYRTPIAASCPRSDRITKPTRRSSSMPVSVPASRSPSKPRTTSSGSANPSWTIRAITAAWSSTAIRRSPRHGIMATASTSTAARAMAIPSPPLSSMAARPGR